MKGGSMKLPKYRIIGIVIFFCLGVVVSMDEYSKELHEIGKGETIDQIIDDYFAKEKTEDAKYRRILKSMLIEWNPHVNDWENLPVGIKIHTTRPTSPFLGGY